jgi:hypothetical protein
MGKIDNNKGVSESIGFVIILGIVITGIGLVTLYGYPALLQEQVNANIKNMERNMIVLQNDMKSLTYRNVPYKETTIQVSGGALYVVPGDPAVIPNPDTRQYFSIDYFDKTGVDKNIRFYPGELRFEPSSGESVVSLENGAVQASYMSGSAMLSEPRWYLDEISGKKTLVINLIRITTPDSDTISREGISTIQMSILPLPALSDDQDYGIAVERPVTITYYSPITKQFRYIKSWENYFGKIPDPPESPDDHITIQVNRVVIKSYEITVDVQGQ